MEKIVARLLETVAAALLFGFVLEKFREFLLVVSGF